MGNPINTFTLNKTGDLFMLTISEVARRHSLSNRQVHEMVRYGYLNVADIKRRSGRGLTYLFSE